MSISREVHLPSTHPGPMGPGARARTRATRVRASRLRRLAAEVLGPVLLFAAWSTAAWTVVLELPPRGGSLLAAALTGSLAWWYLLRTGPARRRARATLRLRGLGRAAPWICATVPVWLLFNLSLAAVHAYWAGPPPAAPGPLEALAREPMAWLPLAVLGLAFAPLAEEIFFRGLVQRALERRIGAPAGILAGAVLFALLHLEPWRLGHLLAGGIVLGAFVHAARSLWAGIALHASANGALALLELGAARAGGIAWPAGPDPGPAASHLLLALCLALLVALRARVRQRARAGKGGARPPAPVASGPPVLALRASPEER